MKKKQCDCYQGYAGRIGVYQFLQPTGHKQQKEYKTDFQDLRSSALTKLEAGITDLAEINRVLGETNGQ